MSHHCQGCTKHYGPFPSCPGCGHDDEAVRPIDPKRTTLRFPSTKRVVELEAELAALRAALAVADELAAFIQKTHSGAERQWCEECQMLARYCAARGKVRKEEP